VNGNGQTNNWAVEKGKKKEKRRNERGKGKGKEKGWAVQQMGQKGREVGVAQIALGMQLLWMLMGATGWGWEFGNWERGKMKMEKGKGKQKQVNKQTGKWKQTNEQLGN